MALGGGTFTSQNKELPGAYINFVSAASASAALSDSCLLYTSLTLIGYNELAVTQTEEVRQALFNIIVGLPLLCFALTLIFMLFYPLNKKRVEENEKKMEALRSKEQA